MTYDYQQDVAEDIKAYFKRAHAADGADRGFGFDSPFIQRMMEQHERIGTSIFQPLPNGPAVKIMSFGDLQAASFLSDRWAAQVLGQAQQHLPLNEIAISADRFGLLPNYEELLG